MNFILIPGSPSTLVVPKGMSVLEPIELRITDAASHFVITAEEGANATVAFFLESVASTLEHRVEVIVKENAKLMILTVQDATRESAVTIKQESKISAGGEIRWQNVSIGGKTVEHDLRSEAIGQGALSQVDWVFYTKDHERQQLSARNVFSAKDGGGEITLKGVAEEYAAAKCNGMIEIGLKGGGTDTYLTEEVLMLDPTAKVDAIPGLEIKTNDVKASHSATVARVTPEDLFYFAARGIAPRDARHMYVRGFLGDLVAKIEQEPLREAVLERIEQKYGVAL
ncbi:SufD family Fe-S cluster assembly protein [Candidatus Peregrinibacteria bacterium]|nr:SufD family Fe-S cluster assembly protein [Candidatus Peregrinibacteria bacterium]